MAMTIAYLKSRCRVDAKTECWEWSNCVQGNGYGRVRHEGKTYYAHRLAWELVNGKIRKGYDIFSDCDNKKCINPDHLIRGTRKQNQEAAKDKGRMSCGLGHAMTVQASARSRAKLDMEKARDIRRLVADGLEPKQAAQQFGVDVSNIRLIVSGKAWREFGLFGLAY